MQLGYVHNSLEYWLNTNKYFGSKLQKKKLQKNRFLSPWKNGNRRTLWSCKVIKYVAKNVPGQFYTEQPDWAVQYVLYQHGALKLDKFLLIQQRFLKKLTEVSINESLKLMIFNRYRNGLVVIEKNWNRMDFFKQWISVFSALNCIKLGKNIFYVCLCL